MMKHKLVYSVLILIIMVAFITSLAFALGVDLPPAPIDGTQPSTSFDDGSGTMIKNDGEKVKWTKFDEGAKNDTAWTTVGWLVHVNKPAVHGEIGKEPSKYITYNIEKWDNSTVFDTSLNGESSKLVATDFNLTNKQINDAAEKLVDYSDPKFDVRTPVTIDAYLSARINVYSIASNKVYGTYNTLSGISKSLGWGENDLVSFDKRYDIKIKATLKPHPYEIKAVTYKKGNKSEATEFNISDPDKNNWWRYPTKAIAGKFPDAHPSDPTLKFRYYDVTLISGGTPYRVEGNPNYSELQKIGGITITAFYSDGSENDPVIPFVQPKPTGSVADPVTLPESHITRYYQGVSDGSIFAEGFISGDNTPKSYSHEYVSGQIPVFDKDGKITGYDDEYSTCVVNYSDGNGVLGVLLNPGKYLSTTNQSFRGTEQYTSASSNISLNPNFNFILARPKFDDYPTVAPWKSVVPDYLASLGVKVGMKPQGPRVSSGKTEYEKVGISVVTNAREYFGNHAAGGHPSEYYPTSYSTNLSDTSVPVEFKVKSAGYKDASWSNSVNRFWSGNKYIDIEPYNTLGFYPEYKMYYDLSENDKDIPIYMVGDQQRVINSPIIKTLKVNGASVSFNPLYIRDARAKALSDKFGGLGVIPKGSTFELGLDSPTTFEVETSAVRLKSAFADAWGYTDYSGSEHNDYVSQIVNQLSSLPISLKSYATGSAQDVTEGVQGNLWVNADQGATETTTYNVAYDENGFTTNAPSDIQGYLGLQNKLLGVLDRGTGEGGWYNEETQAFEIVTYKTTITISKPTALGVLSPYLGPNISKSVNTMFTDGWLHKFEWAPNISISSSSGSTYTIDVSSDKTSINPGFIISDTSVSDLSNGVW